MPNQHFENSNAIKGRHFQKPVFPKKVLKFQADASKATTHTVYRWEAAAMPECFINAISDCEALLKMPVRIERRELYRRV